MHTGSTGPGRLATVRLTISAIRGSLNRAVTGAEPRRRLRRQHRCHALASEAAVSGPEGARWPLNCPKRATTAAGDSANGCWRRRRAVIGPNRPGRRLCTALNHSQIFAGTVIRRLNLYLRVGRHWLRGLQPRSRGGQG